MHQLVFFIASLISSGNRLYMSIMFFIFSSKKISLISQPNIYLQQLHCTLFSCSCEYLIPNNHDKNIKKSTKIY